DPRAVQRFWGQLAQIVPPLTLISAARRGGRALIINAAVAGGLAAAAWALVAAAGNAGQVWFVAIGAYATFSWASALKAEDPATFRLTRGTPAFCGIVLTYAAISFVGYTVTYWAAPYAERTFALDKVELGWWIGAPAALGGFLGVIGGGWLADRLHRRRANGRLLVPLIGLLLPVPLVIAAYSTADASLFLACAFLLQLATSSALGASAAASQALVLPHMRGTATAIFFLGSTL